MSQVAVGKLQNFKKGDTIIQENEISRRMYVVRSGKVRVYKTYMGQKVTIAVLSEGEIFGEMSFLDAQPRSATIEALTEVEAYIIDSEEVDRQFKGLPEWCLPILKTVFDRLRSADTRATMMQSTNEVEKRHFKRDSIGERLYRELLRFNRLVLLIAEGAGASHMTSGVLLHRLGEVLGDHSVNVQVYWKVLQDYEFVDVEQGNAAAPVVIRKVNLKNWNKQLEAEIEAGRCMLLSHSAVAILKRMVNFFKINEETDPKANGEVRVPFTTSDLGLDTMPLAEDGLAELIQAGFAKKEGETVYSVQPEEIVHLFKHQSLLKYFGHAIQHLDN